MLPKIFHILVRFRTYKYSVVSDIKSAFLNIRFVDNFRNYLRFLWFDNILDVDHHVVIMRFTSVIIGLTCSPFLLMKTIEKHMNQYADIDKEFGTKFLRDLYMDDVISGTQDMECAFDFYLFIKTLMSRGCFELRKWHTNSEKLSLWIQDYEQTYFGNQPTSEIESQHLTKILGILWTRDVLIFDLKGVIKKTLNSSGITKRLVLRTVSLIYDPLGFLSCNINNLKLLFQEVCFKKCDWDTSLTIDFITKWNKCLNKLMNANEINVPRHYLNASTGCPQKNGTPN